MYFIIYYVKTCRFTIQNGLIIILWNNYGLFRKPFFELMPGNLWEGVFGYEFFLYKRVQNLFMNKKLKKIIFFEDSL